MSEYTSPEWALAYLGVGVGAAVVIVRLLGGFGIMESGVADALFTTFFPSL